MYREQYWYVIYHQVFILIRQVLLYIHTCTIRLLYLLDQLTRATAVRVTTAAAAYQETAV